MNPARAKLAAYRDAYREAELGRLPVEPSDEYGVDDDKPSSYPEGIVAMEGGPEFDALVEDLAER